MSDHTQIIAAVAAEMLLGNTQNNAHQNRGGKLLFREGNGEKVFPECLVSGV